MTPATTNDSARRPRRAPAAAANAGSTLLIVLLTIAVLATVAGNLMWSASARYHVTYQSASWQEALVAAEAGVDLAMIELRKSVVAPGTAFTAAPWQSGNPHTSAGSGQNLRPFLGGAFDPLGAAGPTNPNLQTFPDYGHAAGPITLSHAGEGNTVAATRVYVDVPGFDAVYQPDPASPTAPTPNNPYFAQLPPSDSALAFLTQNDDPSQRDNPNINKSRWWWRIRAVGTAGVSGPARPSPDARDNRLRRFSFFTDWRNGLSTAANPQVSRLVEVIVQPTSRFTFALLGDKTINLAGQKVLVNSYDSSKGDYSAKIGLQDTGPGSAKTPSGGTNPYVNYNIGYLGNLATNGQLINAGGAKVQGNASTNDGQVIQAQNVTGKQDPNFYQGLNPIKPFTWDTSLVVQDRFTNATINDNYVIQASANPQVPTRIRVNAIDFSNPGETKTITVNPPPPVSSGQNPPGFVQIYINGDLRTAGASQINLDPNVSLIVYVTGSVNLNGSGIVNQSKLPTHLLINGIQPADESAGGAAHQITIAPYDDVNKKGKKSEDGDEDGDDGDDESDGAGNGGSGSVADFNGIVFAPQHDLLLSGQNSVVGQNDFSGAFIASTITVNNNTQVHYDETLRNAGRVSTYKIVNWFEDHASYVH